MPFTRTCVGAPVYMDGFNLSRSAPRITPLRRLNPVQLTALQLSCDRVCAACFLVQAIGASSKPLADLLRNVVAREAHYSRNPAVPKFPWKPSPALTAGSSARHGSPDLCPHRHRASNGGGQEWRQTPDS